MADREIVEFTIDRIPPSLNVVLRTHWIKRRQEQELWNILVIAHRLKLKKVVFRKPVKIIYIVSFKKRRIRDVDNYIGGTKYLTDALKRTFLTRDDSEWLKKIEIGFIIGRQQTKVRIEEV